MSSLLKPELDSLPPSFGTPTPQDRAEFYHWRREGRGRPYGARRDRYPEDDARIIELYEAGLSTREIGRLLHWSQGYVAHRLQRHGIPLRTRGGSRIEFVPEPDLLRKMYLEDNMRVEDIAEHFGVSRTTINRRLLKLGLRRKKLGDTVTPKEIKSARARKASLSRKQFKGRRSLANAA